MSRVVRSGHVQLYLECWDGWDHHSLVLEEGGVGLDKLGLQGREPGGPAARSRDGIGRWGVVS